MPDRFCPIGSFPYTVQQGDTFSKIALLYGTTVERLREINMGLNEENLEVGSTICINPFSQKSKECESGNYYVVRLGDTLFEISRIFNVELKDLIDLNPNAVAEDLKVGQILCIPKAPSPITIYVNLSSKVMTVVRDGIVQTQYLVAVGKEETPSPTGFFTIINKAVNPGGPYGTRWMALSIRGYGIHGTNDPQSIGKARSNGCIRMYNNDVEELFSITPIGTRVIITP